MHSGMCGKPFQPDTEKSTSIERERPPDRKRQQLETRVGDVGGSCPASTITRDPSMLFVIHVFAAAPISALLTGE